MALQLTEIVEMIDWYDGIVQAVVSLEGMKGKYLCSLIVFDADLKKRVFALLPVSNKELNEIRLLLDDWKELISYLKQLWTKADGDVVVLQYEDLKEQVISKNIIKASKVKKQIAFNIERAVDKRRMVWFDVFECD